MRAGELAHITSPTSLISLMGGSCGPGSPHPVDRSNYGQSRWRHILRDQLQVDVADFWAGAHDGVKPHRGLPEPPAEALPADLVHLLISRVGLGETEVAAMSKQDAVARLQRYWTGVVSG